MKRRTLLCLTALLVGSVVSGSGRGAEIAVATFSDLAAGGTPHGWRPWDFPSVDRTTDYRLAEEDGRVVLRATSQAAASAISRELSVDPDDHPYLTWSWKTGADCFSGQWDEPDRDDFPLRLFVLFERSRGFLSMFSLKDRFSRLSGNALLYVAPGRPQDGEARTSHLSDRIRVVPLETQGDGWSRLTRNVHDDYVTLFDQAPRRVKGIALMTDTDNSGTACVSHFGDIAFSATAD